MGLHLSEASSHEKAYKELIAHIDDGYEITLEKLQHVLLKYSRTLHPASRAFAAKFRSSYSRQRRAVQPAPAAATLVVARPALLGTPATQEALALAALFRPRKSPLKRSSTGKIRVSTKSTSSLPLFSTSTRWPPSKFSLMLVATVFSTNKLAALLQQTLTRSCSLPTPTETMPDGLSLSVFYVQLVGTYTDISMWRAVFFSP